MIKGRQYLRAARAVAGAGFITAAGGCVKMIDMVVLNRYSTSVTVVARGMGLDNKPVSATWGVVPARSCVRLRRVAMRGAPEDVTMLGPGGKLLVEVRGPGADSRNYTDASDDWHVIVGP